MTHGYRITGLLAAVSLLLVTAPAGALPPVPVPYDGHIDREALIARDPGWLDAHADTVWFGGSGLGNGTVVRGGVWNWEADSGEPPEYFLDGDPVGNHYRDGWTFEDHTARRGPSQSGAGHWSAAGVYDFDDDTGSFAHRATTHANDGENDGPDPLAGAWSMWIGTNLRLNPEHCGWVRTRGYGSGWSQGFLKSFAIPPGDQGIQYAIRFTHRYATEAGWDSCLVEVSFDGILWWQAGEPNPNGMYSGGTFANPRPSPAGGTAVVNLITWPTSNAGTLWVRFRLASDALVADDNVGGNYMWAWQVDDIQLLRDGSAAGPLSTFETAMDGWQPRSFEGFDFDLTGDPERPAGRIEQIANLAAPLVCECQCPEAYGLENRILLFADRDDLDLNDAFQNSRARSPAFAIGGPSVPDLDGDEGRLIQVDWYMDGGSGLFETGAQLAWMFWPANANHCPHAPSTGEPGAGTVFNWTTEQESQAHLFSTGLGTHCADDVLFDCSAFLPGAADSVIISLGAVSQCRSDPTCDINDNGTPFFDNVRFGVYDPEGIRLLTSTLDRYADNFPTSNAGFPLTATARLDAAYGLGASDSPPRWVRSDTAAVATSAENAAIYLRFAVERGPCQPNLGHPFFAAFPPSAPGSYPDALLWHASRMDTARSHGIGSNLPGVYMTCFHEADAYDGTYWTGAPPANEPCDDILPDGLFTAGTTIYYFFEARDALSGQVTGTFPAARGLRAVTTAPGHRDLWLQSNVLPMLAPDCAGDYAHNMLVLNDYATTAVPGRVTRLRERLVATLSSLGLGFDVYDKMGSNYSSCYDGIGRREDRQAQQPRPPYNGATDLMLASYDCIWYSSGLLDRGTLSDLRTLSFMGGQPSMDQQKLETWLAGCSEGNPRLLMLEGTGWAADIDENTVNGPSFLANRGVDLLAADYAQELAGNDLRRCARLAGTALAPDFAGEAFGSGCPDDIELNVLGAINSGEPVAYFVESLEDGCDPVNCADDVPRPAWQAVVRRTNPNHACEKSVAMSVAFAELLPLDCVEQCLFDNFVVNGANAELVIDLFQWAGQPVSAEPIGVEPETAPRLVNALATVAPNPVSRRGTEIRYSIATRGRVTLRICGVSGRLVRTLVDEEQEPIAGGRAVVWDGRNDAGRAVGRGVYLYELRAPGYAAARKLVLLD